MRDWPVIAGLTVLTAAAIWGAVSGGAGLALLSVGVVYLLMLLLAIVVGLSGDWRWGWGLCWKLPAVILAWAAVAAAVLAAVYYGLYCDWWGRETVWTVIALLVWFWAGSSGSGGSRNWEGNVGPDGG